MQVELTFASQGLRKLLQVLWDPDLSLFCHQPEGPDGSGRKPGKAKDTTLGKTIHQGKHEASSKKLTQEKHNKDVNRVRHAAESTRWHSGTAETQCTELYLQKPTLK